MGKHDKRKAKSSIEWGSILIGAAAGTLFGKLLDLLIWLITKK